MKNFNSIGFASLLFLGSFALAEASVQKMNITYSDCSVIEGTLPVGLSEPPDEVEAQFVFLSPSFPPPMAPPTFEPDVLSASLTLGNVQMTANDLVSPLSMNFEQDIDNPSIVDLVGLSWSANVVADATEMGLDFLNNIAELTVRGTNAGTGEAFEYHCPRTDTEVVAVEPVPRQLDVTYSQCTIVEGPLSLGLSALPDEVQAQFVFLSSEYPPPTAPDEDFEPTVLSASMTLGDATMTAFDLVSPLSMRFEQDIDNPAIVDITALSWAAELASLTTQMGLDALNSIAELTVRGIDDATGEAFEYNCPRTEAEVVDVEPVPVQMDVTYSQCAVVNGPGPGPLGLPELPEAVQAQFVFLSPTFPPPATPQAFEPAVLSASMTLGDVQMTADDLVSPLSLRLAPDINTGIAGVHVLNWEAELASLVTRMGVEVLNSIAELTVRGVYAGTGQAFEYNCPRTEATLTPPGTKEIAIDIRPLSKRNKIYLKWQRHLPVAVLSDESFDARQVDPVTVRFGPDGARALPLRLHAFDVDFDGDKDRVFIFKLRKTGIRCGDTSASLSAATFAGEPLMGTDFIKVKRCRGNREW